MACFLQKNLKHFDIPLNDETFVKLHPTDTINIQTLKRIKIVKEHGLGLTPLWVL